jgi:ribosomal protein S18 acetylase RimI-like enzyme
MRGTLHTALEVQVRPLRNEELARVQQALPPEHPEAHARRLADQRAGRITYLVAWTGDRPVGHAIVRWRGTTNPELRWRLGDAPAHPYVEALLVDSALRSRTIGSQILSAAEQLACSRQHARIGLAVSVENVRARALYERRGYHDLGIGEFENAWSYVDDAGNEVAERETCTYLVRELREDVDGHSAR